MPDKDLRRAALDKSKTVSRKAANRALSVPSTPGASAPGSKRTSRAASRIASRDVSDDEDHSGFLSDTDASINSIDAFLESDEFAEGNLDNLRHSLGVVIDELVERKGSTTTGREDALERFNRLLISHHFGDVIYGRVTELLATLVRSVKAGTKEAILALRALSLVGVSFEDASLYETCSAVIKRTITDTEDNVVKAAGVHALGMALTFGGASEDEIDEQCGFLLEIVQSDGSFVGADDSAEVVCASLQTYAFLSTQIEDMENESEDAVEAFLEQLNSGDVNVQIAAGEAIAVLFEKSYTAREDDDSDEDEEEDSSGDSDEPSGDKTWVKRYNAYHNPSEVSERVSALANLSSKGMNKADKRRLHSTFAAITKTVENPRLGPGRLVVRIHREGEIKVDKWWKLVRLNALRRLLAGGMMNHYFEGNRQVLNALPLLIRNPGGSGTLSPRGRGKRPGDRYRESRKFVNAGE